MILRRHLVQTAASAAAASASSANRSSYLLTTTSAAAAAFTAQSSCRRHASSSSSPSSPSGSGTGPSSAAASNRSASSASSQSRDHEPPPPYITNGGAPPPKVLRSLASSPSSSSTASKTAKSSAARSAAPSKSSPSPSTSNNASNFAATQIEPSIAKSTPSSHTSTVLSNADSTLPPAGSSPLPSSFTSTSPPTEGTAPTSKEPVTLWSRAKSAYETLKFLFLFYWNGVKQIFRNRTRVKEIQARVAQPGGAALSREESQLIRIHNSDMRKLPLFLAIVLILEELLPLVVIYAPGLLPSTCILPSQMTKIRGKEEDKRKEAVRRLRELSSSLTVASTGPQGATPEGSANAWDEEVKQAVGALNPSAVKDLALTFKLATWGGSFLQRRRLSSHLSYLREDDALMAGVATGEANTGKASMSIADQVPQDVDGLARACSERGLRASGIDSVTMSEALRSWLRETQPAHGASTPSASELLQLPLRLYDATPAHQSSLTDASKETPPTASATAGAEVLAEARAVAHEVVEAEKEIFERDRRAEEEVKRKMEEQEREDALPNKSRR
ncbi:hypothetical protein OC845_006017 [Tilletia horrida]|nr:hypothetical protein OC845_006017 [Tilletia horrida]